MDSFQTFIILMFVAAIIVSISQKMEISYPIGLVIGGAAMGFMPFNHDIDFDPNLILIIVLPPILYYASFGISFREFMHNWREILSLALGLVVLTTLVIGLLFKWLFPEFSWALAFAFGAIISPPDAVAATTILKRFKINNRLLTILEGESLINDASAIVLYRMAVAALLSGIFSLFEGSIYFVKSVSGGLAVGFIFGYLVQNFSRHYLVPVVAVVFSITIPYITYIIADSMGFSGVLAVVVCGLMGAKIVLRHHSSLRRILGYITWDIYVIFLNCFVFVLIGLQLSTLTRTMTVHQLVVYTAYAFLITFTMLLIRMAWVYAKSSIEYVKALSKPKSHVICPQILRESALIGWSGMRGIVSLAAALALPYTLPDGAPLEGRNELIFITFVVILLTLVIPGLTLAPFIRWLNIPQQNDEKEEYQIKKRLTSIAEKKIKQLHHTKKINDEEADFLTTHFNLQLRQIELTSSEKTKLQSLEHAKGLVIKAQRKELLKIWELTDIDDKLLLRIEQELDLEEISLARAELY